MIPGHPHTVSSSSVPLYMRGYPAFLGQDEMPIDPSSYDFGTTLIPPEAPAPLPDIFLPQTSDLPGMDPSSELSPGGTLIAPASVDPQTAALAQLYQSAVASGTMTPAQAASALAASAASVAKAATGIPGPSPRVATPAVPGSLTSLLSSQSIIKGVPDILLLGGGLLAIAVIGKR